MEIKIQEETEHAVLNRKDYTVRVFHEGATPSRAVLRKALAKETKTDENLVIVRRINGIFGDSASIVELSVYADGESMKEFEPAYMAERHKSTEAESKGDEKTPASGEGGDE